MTAGRKVVEDYHHVGLTLRQHPVSFLRDGLAKSLELASIAGMDAGITLPMPQGDYGPIRSPLGNLPQELYTPRHIYIRDLHLDTSR